MLTDPKLRSQVDALWYKFWTGRLANLEDEFAGAVARVDGLPGRMGESERQVNGLFESMLNEGFGGQ